MTHNLQFSIKALNEVSLLIEFEHSPPSPSEKVNSTVMCLALAQCKKRLLTSHSETVRDCVLSYNAILIYFDLLATDTKDFYRQVEQSCKSALSIFDEEAFDLAELQKESNTIEIPVLYNSRCGPDLQRVAQHNNISEEEVIRRHSTTSYRAYALGFIPGFAYLGYVDDSIVTPRLTSPRKSLPAGAVGIADAQTGVYPSASPGGWNIIGRTPISMFAHNSLTSPLINIADQVIFNAIDEQTFIALGGDLDEAFQK